MKRFLQNIHNKRILLFLILTFVLTFTLEISVVWKLVNSNNPTLQSMSKLAMASMMFIPSICVVLTRIITKEGFSNLYIKPNLKGNLKYYLFAWFMPAILITLGAVTYFLLFPNKFDSSLSYLANVNSTLGVSLSVDQLKTALFSQIAIGVFLAPIINALPCLGEEWAWRGYLLPKMSEKFKPIPMLLINGIIWGLWHAPLTMIGHNYGIGYWGFPFMGILAMCFFCIVMGILFSYITIKTKSCWPAVFAHASLNGLAATSIYFTVDGGNPFIGPAPTGIIGGIGFILMAVILTIKLNTQKHKL